MKRALIILMIIILPAAAITAQEKSDTLTLTLQEAVAKAEELNLTLQAGRESISSARKSWEMSWNQFIPSASLTTGLSRSNTATSGSTVIPINEISTGIYDQLMVSDYELSPWSLLANLNFQWAVNPAMFDGIESLEQDYQSALLEQAQSREDLVFRVQQGFYQLLLLQEQIRILQQQIETMEERYRDMQTMYRNGFITQLDLLQTEAGLAQMRPGLIKLENGYQLALLNFRMTLGLDLDQPLKLVGAIGLPEEADPDQALRDFDPRRRLDIQSLDLGLRQLETGLSASKNQMLPTLSLSWNYNPMLSDPFDGDMWSNLGDNISDRGSFSVMVSLPLDVWLPFSQTRSDQDGMESQMAQMRIQRKMAVQAAELEVRNMAMTLNASEQNIEALQKNLELAEEQYRMNEIAYRNGSKALTDLETAEDDLLSARFSIVEEQYNYLTTWLELKKALGSRPERR